jgi:hypothetical protein
MFGLSTPSFTLQEKGSPQQMQIREITHGHSPSTLSRFQTIFAESYPQPELNASAGGIPLRDRQNEVGTQPGLHLRVIRTGTVANPIAAREHQLIKYGR